MALALPRRQALPWFDNRPGRRLIRRMARRFLDALAVAGANINSTTDGVSGLTITSDASFTPTANALVLMALSVGNLDANADPGVPSSVVGNGLTWALIDRQIFGTRRSVYLYRGMAASPSNGTVVATWGVNVAGNMIVDEFTGVDTSGTDGSGAIVQSAKNTASATSLTVTLAAFADAVNNATYGCFGHQAAEATTFGAGFTELSDETTNPSLETEWRTGGDTTVDASWSTSSNSGGIAVEIAAAPAGGQPIARRRLGVPFNGVIRPIFGRTW